MRQVQAENLSSTQFTRGTAAVRNVLLRPISGLIYVELLVTGSSFTLTKSSLAPGTGLLRSGNLLTITFGPGDFAPLPPADYTRLAFTLRGFTNSEQITLIQGTFTVLYAPVGDPDPVMRPFGQADLIGGSLFVENQGTCVQIADGDGFFVIPDYIRYRPQAPQQLEIGLQSFTPLTGVWLFIRS